MTLDAREKSVCDGIPFEAYWFTCGASSWRYTGGDQPRTINGCLYDREVISRSEVEQVQESRAGSIKVQLPLDNPVAELFAATLSPRPVSLVIFGGQDGDSDAQVIFTGMVSSVRRTDVCELNVVTEHDTMKQTVPGLMFQIQCPRDIFSDGCGLRRQDWEVLATLTNVSGAILSSPAFAAKPDGWFRGGWISWNGTAMAIVAHTGADITLFFPLDGIPIGAGVVAYPGCQGTEAECANKFDNLVNHLGFGRMPTKNPFGSAGIA